MTPRARRALFTVILFFSVCAVVGSLLQRRVGAQSSEDESQLRDSLKSFTNVYALVEQNYAEPIQGDKADAAIYDGAIPGMLRVLDPHSNFYDPKAYAKMREDQHGRYYGVGMTIQQTLAGKVFVVFPMEGGPAFKAGVQGTQGHIGAGDDDARRPGEATQLSPGARRDSEPLRGP
jgi:carboxyl-terminal processing protease